MSVSVANPISRIRALFQDPPPESVGAAYAQLRARCLRDCPMAECFITLSGMHAHFLSDPLGVDSSAGVLEVTVIVAIDRDTRRGSVRITAAGSVSGQTIEYAGEVLDVAVAYARDCHRSLKRWGMAQ